MITGTDLDTFVDNRPMNDEELSRLHESTLQMFRSNKIGPKNAFDIVLIDYLPAIFETTTFEDDRVNHFQSVGTTLETSGKTKKRGFCLTFSCSNFQQKFTQLESILFIRKHEKLSRFFVRPAKTSIDCSTNRQRTTNKRRMKNDESRTIKKSV